MRRLKELDKKAQARVRDYIAKWPTLSTRQLASDLYLRPTTVAAVRAHITRRAERRFNEVMSG